MKIAENLEINEYSGEYAIEVFNLRKDYKIRGKKKIIQALKGINLKVRKGEILGLLGPNGAGKTTLVSILTTLMQPTSGSANILGHDILNDSWFVKENTGLMLGGEMIYYILTGYKNLKYFCRLYGVKNYKEKIKELMEKLNLSDWINQYVSTYSKGMKMKLALARVLLTEPKILFLDEPLLGIDPLTTIELISLLREMNTTIFLTSHQMDVVSKLCDRIAFLKEGNILKIDTQENFKKLITEKVKVKIKVSQDKEKLIKSLKPLEFISQIKKIDEDIYFTMLNEKFYPELFTILKNYPIINFSEEKPSLEDVFIKLA